MKIKVPFITISISFPSVLLVLFVGLKLTGYINWSWIWVLSPLWLGPVAVMGIFLFFFLFIFSIPLILKMGSTGSNKKTAGNTKKEPINVTPQKNNIYRETVTLTPEAKVSNEQQPCRTNVHSPCRNDSITDAVQNNNPDTQQGTTPLLTAVRLKNVGLTERLLSHPDTDINKTSSDGRTALMIAVEDKNIPIALMLLGQKDINTKIVYSRDNSSIAMKALELTEYQVIEKLVQINGIDFYIESNDKKNMLMQAIEQNNSKILSSLLSSQELDVNKPNSQGEYLLHYAVAKRKNEAVNQLLKVKSLNLNNLNHLKQTALHIAVSGKYLYAVKLLASDSRIDFSVLNFDYKTAFQCAIEINDMSILKLMAKQPALDVNIVRDKSSYLYDAMNHRNDELFQLLVSRDDCNVNLKVKDSTLLMKAIDYQNVSAVKMLLARDDCNPNLTYKSSTPLQLSFELNETDRGSCTEIIKLLLAHPAIDINHGFYRSTAIFLAVMSKDLEITRMVLENPKLDLSRYDSEHCRSIESLFEKPIKEENIKMIKLLLECDKLDVNARDWNSKSPIEKAIVANNPEIVNLFLKNKKIDLYNENRDGMIPIDYLLKRSTGTINNFIDSFLEEYLRRNPNDIRNLIYAVKTGKASLTQSILENTNLNINDMVKDGNENKIPFRILFDLHFKVDDIQAKDIDFYKIFINHPNYNPNLTDEDGTALIETIRRIWTRKNSYASSIINILLSHPKINVNQQDKKGLTALHWAASCSNIKVLRLLLRRPDIDMLAKTKSGETPQDYTSEVNLEEIRKKVRPQA